MADDPRDDELVKTIASSVGGMIRAVHYGDRLRLIGEVNRLLTSIIEYDAVLSERPADEALRRAVARL